jgi:uncharacterized protein (TIGR02147 family)
MGFMPSIFDYTDYRQYLREYYVWAKANVPGFSHRWFLHKGGMAPPSYLKKVMDGKHHLTEESIPKFAAGLGLEGGEKEFFTALVRYTQTRVLRGKDRHLVHMMEIKRRRESAVLDSDKYELYKDWYNIAVREALSIIPYQNNPGDIAEILIPKVQTPQVEKAIELLRKLQLIKMDKDGFWQAATTVLLTNPAHDAKVIPEFHRKMARLGTEAIAKFPKTERYYTGTTLSVSEEVFALVTEKMKKLRAEILELVRHAPSPTRVYHLNMQLFPLTAELPASTDENHEI